MKPLHVLAQARRPCIVLSALLVAAGCAFSTNTYAQSAGPVTMETGITTRVVTLGLFPTTTTLRTGWISATGTQTQALSHANLVTTDGGVELASEADANGTVSVGGVTGQATAHIDAGTVRLLRGLVSLEAPVDDISFNLLTLQLGGEVQVPSVTVGGIHEGSITVHVPFAAGDTPLTSSIVVQGYVRRETVVLPGLITISGDYWFDGELVPGDAGVNLAPQPGELRHHVAATLIGRLQGGTLMPALDIAIAVGDTHVFPASP